MPIEQVTKTEKEIKQMVEDKVGRGFDIHRVDGADPNFHYRWLNTHKQNLESKKIRGWEIVTGDKKIKSLAESPDSTHAVGDLILARMPKSKYDEMQAQKREMGDRRRKIYKEKFQEEARRAGVKSFDENK